MCFTKESALESAKRDLSKRLKVSESEIGASVSDADFPDMSLGAAEKGEMAAQMISSGWKIGLTAKGRSFEYRADRYQLRLKDFNGKNIRVSG